MGLAIGCGRRVDVHSSQNWTVHPPSSRPTSCLTSCFAITNRTTGRGRNSRLSKVTIIEPLVTFGSWLLFHGMGMGTEKTERGDEYCTNIIIPFRFLIYFGKLANRYVTSKRACSKAFKMGPDKYNLSKILNYYCWHKNFGFRMSQLIVYGSKC